MLKLQETAHPSFEPFVESLISWAKEAFGLAAFVDSRNHYQMHLGKFFPEDKFFEDRTKYLIHLFLFADPAFSSPTEGLSSTGSSSALNSTPYSVFLRSLGLSSDLAETLEGAGSRSETAPRPAHSLYQVAKSRKDYVILKDFFTQEKVRCELDPAKQCHLAYFKDAILQNFVFQVGARNILAEGGIFHHESLRSWLRKQIKRKVKAKTLDTRRFLDLLAGAHVRHHRLSHVPPLRIYSAIPEA